MGEGSGKSLDLDAYDASYLHLFLWSKTEGRLAGGYRLGLVDRIGRTAGVNGLYTHALFELSSKFVAELNPVIEMGRSFIHPNFERQAAHLSLLWRGIGKFSSSTPTRISLGPLASARATQGHQRTCYFVFSKQTILITACLRKFAQELHTDIHSPSPQETVYGIPPMISKKSAI
ncbi:MAG: GNAT family N-acetyltransferase [SAR324 cluster bacterium]|nr:GNAT family N-acetyltransferase [SAR324 cluster bacterium]